MMRRVLKYLGLLLVGLSLLACGMHVVHSGNDPVPPRQPETLRVATLNVHYIVMEQEAGAWSRGDWQRRRPAMDAAFKAVGADIFALQESESFPDTNRGGANLVLDHLLAQNPDYQAAAVGDPSEFPSTQPILYRPDRLTLVDQGWFFFSDTPDVIYSRTFNGSWPAFASWAEFRAGDGPVFRVVNLHFEYRSRSNRQLSAALVRDRVAPVIEAGTPVIVLGDTNARAGARTMDILAEAGVSFLPVDGATYHLNRGVNLFGAIDHIGHSAVLTPVGAPVVLRQKFAGEWPTDHYPVLAEFTLPQ